MALPSRLNPVTRSLSQVTKVINPTGVGVLLSVGAHAALLIFGPRTDFSFAALSQAAQEAAAQETIVPLVQLSPVERNRLPDFAQPRSALSNPTGFGNLPLPSGLPPVPNTSILRRRPVAAKPFPSATLTPPPTSVRPIAPLPLSRTLPSSIPLRTRPSLPSLPPLGQLPNVAVVPTPPPPVTIPQPETLPTPDESNEPNDQTGSAADLLPSPTAPTSGRSIAEALEQTEAGDRSPSSVAVTPDTGETTPNASSEEKGTESTAIPVLPPAIATASAQGGSTLLLNGNNAYDATAVSEDEAKEREDAWLLATAEGRENIATGTADLTINSGFKACREIPPANGRLGVVVNPDGTQVEATVLKSIGYDVLNRLALRTLEYEDLETSDVPTQYKINVSVIYQPDGCAASVSPASESPAAAPTDEPTPTDGPTDTPPAAPTDTPTDTPTAPTDTPTE